ncbi:hypothetical protein JQ631_22445 [Bradyrhizobium manausense]|uniref:hypothetical protein n=1 Tax=Bradyrhizobium manausense TaxID=989370 RepID=UPI001BA57E9C|nr:hypothetical protein [Bradyrhizobium manausense]MBR0791850.1 hypothetical protein [Bradyrhizobium manausense]
MKRSLSFEGQFQSSATAANGPERGVHLSAAGIPPARAQNEHRTTPESNSPQPSTPRRSGQIDNLEVTRIVIPIVSGK